MPATAATNAPKDKQFKVYVAGQKRGLSQAIKRAFRRRSAVEPVIGHLKNEHRMNRNYLAGTSGDAANAALAAAGYNFRLLVLLAQPFARLVGRDHPQQSDAINDPSGRLIGLLHGRPHSRCRSWRYAWEYCCWVEQTEFRAGLSRAPST
jgi:hypothetical protein